MEEGIIQEENIAKFLIDSGYDPYNVLPISCILSGSRAYGLALPNADRDYIGIHLMDTFDCLEHPQFQPKVQVIRKRFTSDLEEIQEGIKGGSISLDSFEMWKYMTLYLKGSFVAYELLFLPTIHEDPSASAIFDLMREGLTSRFGRVARGFCTHNWIKDRDNRKKTVMTYYRLIQALYLLREGEFEWNADTLLEYVKPSGLITYGLEVIKGYMDEETRSMKIDRELVPKVGNELDSLLEALDRALIVTALPDRVPRAILDNIRYKVKMTRSSMI